jgi:AcrR family transcriptional regulator
VKSRRPLLQARKRPRQARSAATVEAVLEAAARILERRGLDALSTNAAALRAGVSIGSLYQYFPSKHALVAELARRQQAALLAGLQAALVPRPRSLADAVDRLVAVATDAQLDRPGLARALDYAEATLPDDAELDALNARIGTTVAEALQPFLRGRPATDVATRDVIAIARGMIDAAGRAGELDSASLKERVVRAVLGYLAPGRPGLNRD